MTLPESLRQIEKIFPNAPPGILKTIPVIGCCSEHAESFQWYREHDWKELRNEIRDNGDDQTRGLDPIEFGSLDPVAFHYFLPGLLTGVGDIAMAQKRNEEGEFGFYDFDPCFVWLQHVTLPLKDCRKTFVAEYLPAFNEQERSAVREFLSAFASYLDQWHLRDKEKIDKALKEVWK